MTSIRKDLRKALGRFGETAAAGELWKRGYEIIERNWRCRAGEIDIVARQGEDIVFVEVRTKRTGGPLSPEESVNAVKQEKLAQLAELYLESHPDLANKPYRIDVAAVEVGRSGLVERINVIENAVEGF
jgi:putative endonuclease